MYGAILSDIIGSPFEFDLGNKRKEFPLFSERPEFTDDTVMTMAVAEAFLDAADEASVHRMVRLSAEMTDNHPEGIKDAEVTAPPPHSSHLPCPH